MSAVDAVSHSLNAAVDLGDHAALDYSVALKHRNLADVYNGNQRFGVVNVLQKTSYIGHKNKLFSAELSRDLSGGEKGRVSLAKLMLSKANFLILDEPTNHLDMVSKEVLENALNAYEGTVLYVSHDRYFINRTASRILSLTKTVLLNYPGNNSEKTPDRFIGNYDFYLEKSAQVEETLLQDAYRDGQGVRSAADSHTSPRGNSVEAGLSSPAAEAGNAGSSGSSKLSWEQQKEEQARIRKAANALRKCEEKITEYEEKIASLEEQMALPENYSDAAKLAEINSRKEQLEEELAALYEEWEELSENA